MPWGWKKKLGAWGELERTSSAQQEDCHQDGRVTYVSAVRSHPLPEMRMLRPITCHDGLRGGASGSLLH